MTMPAHIHQSMHIAGFQDQPYRAENLFKKGYDDAMMLDYTSQNNFKGDPAYMSGWNNGMVALNSSIPLTVHHMLHVALAHAHLNIDSRITMITPPLSSFSRRSVHILLGPVRDKVEVFVKGDKREHQRRIEIRYPSKKKEGDSKVVKVLQHQDKESSIFGTNAPEGA